jgi:hypothetical protein
VDISDIVNAICYDSRTTETGRIELVDRILSAEGLMKLLGAYNWNDGYDIPKAIALHPAADLAVALNLFWLASADEWYGNPEPPEEDWALEGFDFCRLITERILAGCYAVGSASYDPGFNRVALYHFRRSDFPEVFYTPVAGKTSEA